MPVILLATCGQAALAGNAGFQGARAITGYDVGDTGVLYIRFADAGGCGLIGIVPRSKPYYGDMLAMTMTAYSSGKPLNVYLASCPQDGSLPEIVRMVQGSVF